MIRLWTGVLVAAGLLVLLVVANLTVRAETFGRLYASAADAPVRDAALVPGAEVYADGRPSPALASRLDVAIELYRLGRVRTLLLSGGQGSFEVDAMTAYLRTRGVPAGALVLDPGGERTHDSCRRAGEVYGVRSATVVSQAPARVPDPRALRARARVVGIVRALIAREEPRPMPCCSEGDEWATAPSHWRPPSCSRVRLRRRRSTRCGAPRLRRPPRARRPPRTPARSRRFRTGPRQGR